MDPSRSSEAEVAPPTAAETGPRWQVRMCTMLFALMWALPFLLGTQPRIIVSFSLEWTSAALGTAAFGCWFAAQRSPCLLVPRSSCWLVALAAFLLIQPIFVKAPYIEPNIAHACYVLWAAAMILFAANLRAIRGIDSLSQIAASSLLIGGILVALTGWFQKYVGPEWMRSFVPLPSREGWITGNIRHRTYFADYLTLAAVGAGYLYSIRVLHAGLAMAGCALLGIIVSLASSRGVVLSGALLLGLCAALWIRTRHTEVLRAAGCIAVFLLFFALAPVLLPHADFLLRTDAPEVEAISAMDRLFSGQDATGLALRGILWKAAIDIFASAPWFGVGADGYTWHYYLWMNTGNAMGYTINAHNLFLQSLAAFGLLGGGLLIVCFVGLVLRTWRQGLAPEYLLVTSVLLVLLTRSMLDLPLWFAHWLAIAALAIGLYERGFINAAWTPRRTALLASSGIAGALLLAWTAYAYVDLRSLWTDYQSTSHVAQRLQRARLNFFLTPVVDSVITDSYPLVKKNILERLALNSRVMRWRPYGRITYRQTAFLALGGFRVEACQLLRRTAQVHFRQLPWFRTLLTAAPISPSLHELRHWVDGLARDPSAKEVCP